MWVREGAEESGWVLGGKDALFGQFAWTSVGRGHDDSETAGPRVPGPDGGRD